MSTTLTITREEAYKTLTLCLRVPDRDPSPYATDLRNSVIYMKMRRRGALKSDFVTAQLCQAKTESTIQIKQMVCFVKEKLDTAVRIVIDLTKELADQNVFQAVIQQLEKIEQFISEAEILVGKEEEEVSSTNVQLAQRKISQQMENERIIRLKRLQTSMTEDLNQAEDASEAMEQSQEQREEEQRQVAEELQQVSGEIESEQRSIRVWDSYLAEWNSELSTAETQTTQINALQRAKIIALSEVVKELASAFRDASHHQTNLNAANNYIQSLIK